MPQPNTSNAEFKKKGFLCSSTIHSIHSQYPIFPSTIHEMWTDKCQFWPYIHMTRSEMLYNSQSNLPAKFLRLTGCSKSASRQPILSLRCTVDRFTKTPFLELGLRLWIFFLLGPIETMFRKYTFHKNRFFYPHRAKLGQKMPKKGQKWPKKNLAQKFWFFAICLLYTSPSPRDYAASRMPSSA